MPLANLRVGLSLKFIFLTTLLIVLTSLTLGFFFLRSKEKDYLEFLKSRGVALSRTLAFNSEYGVLARNTEALAKLVQGVIQEADISYCAIHDAQGKILVELYRDDPSKIKIPRILVGRALSLKLSEESTLIQSYSSPKAVKAGYDIATVVKTRRLARTKEKGEPSPGYQGILDEIKRRLRIEGQIVEEKIGTVRVGLSLTQLNLSILKMKSVIGMITLLVAFVGILVTTILVQLIVRPIRRLVYGTRQIARGDLTYEVKVHSRDEIGELASSFNQMTLFLRRSHEQVEEYRKNLEQMVDERTQKLHDTESELIRSEKFAAIGELISGITHELNNKLTPILGYAQIFKTMDLDDRVMKFMEIIEESALNAKKIVESLLKFSRTAPPQKTYTHLNETMKSTLALVEPHIRKNNISLELDLDKNLPMTLADPALISQAMLNILNNAWQAMEEKGGKLTVRSCARDGKIFFVIQDTGIGISKENLTKIFDPFFSTKEVGKGTGLGLAISYGIIQSHEGTIHVESRPGQGSIFTIELPIKTPGEPLEKPRTRLEPKKPKRSARILVIEDEPSVQELLTDALADDHDVQTASNGHEAQEAIERERFDIYLIDLRMPVMDGRELYEWIKQHFPAERGKVIFITGDTYDEKTQIFLNQVKRPQLNKPFQIQTLKNIIAQELEAVS